MSCDTFYCSEYADMSLHYIDMQYISLDKMKTLHERDDYISNSDYLVFIQCFGCDGKGETRLQNWAFKFVRVVYLTHIFSVSLFYLFLKRRWQRFIWKILKVMYIIYVYIYCKHVLNVSSKGRLHGCILMFLVWRVLLSLCIQRIMVWVWNECCAFA